MCGKPHIIKTDPSLNKYYRSIVEKSDIHYRIVKQLKKFNERERNFSIKELTQNIRTATSMKNGIPYAMQDSYGDFITRGNDTINYEDFVKIIIDKEQRIKFKQLIQFWTTLLDNDGSVNQIKLDKIRAWILFLFLIESTTMK